MDNKKIALKKELIYHINKYYSLQPGEKAELSDEEYDSLMEKFLSLGGTREELPLGEKGDFHHDYKVKSLGKVNDVEKLKKIMVDLAPGIIEPKYDGLTLVHYRKLGKIITRGDGEYGKDITDMAIKIPSIKRVFDTNINDSYIIRGEGIISKKNFDIINSNRKSQGLSLYKNARNAISGILQSDDDTNLKYIDFFAYNIMGSELSESEQIDIIKSLKYDVTGYYNYRLDNLDNAAAWISVFDKNSTPYEIDGLVIKTNKPNSLKLYGETEHHPKNAIAYKFKSQGEWTILNKVTWHVGRTGKIVPVGHFNPISLLGSTITKATLHNINYIKLLDLRIGDNIYVIKANDVIPKILKNKVDEANNEIEVPILCPICNEPIVTKNNEMYCSNEFCMAKTVKRTVHLCEALEIKEISTKTIEKLYNTKMISQPYDIFNLQIEDFMKLEGYSDKSSMTAYQNIQNKKFVPFDKFLYACCIPLIGKVASKDIANHFGKFSTFLVDLMSGGKEIKNVKNIGDLMINSLINNIDIIKKYLLFINPTDIKVTTKNYHIMNVVLTGKMDSTLMGRHLTRKEISKLMHPYGEVKSSVTNDVNFVVCDELKDVMTQEATFDGITYNRYVTSDIDTKNASKKIKDAVAKKVPIISFKTFETIFNQVKCKIEKLKAKLNN